MRLDGLLRERIWGLIRVHFSAYWEVSNTSPFHVTNLDVTGNHTVYRAHVEWEFKGKKKKKNSMDLNIIYWNLVNSKGSTANVRGKKRMIL